MSKETIANVRARIRETAYNENIFRLEDLLELKEAYGYDEFDEPSFFELMHKDQFYYFVKQQLEMIFLNNNGEAPSDLMYFFRDKIFKAVFMVLIDICGTREGLDDIMNLSRRTILHYLRAENIYDYYTDYKDIRL